MSQPNIIQEITNASAVLFKKSLKFYTLADLIKKTHVRQKNLYEMCFQYPTKGKFKFNYNGIFVHNIFFIRNRIQGLEKNMAKELLLFGS